MALYVPEIACCIPLCPKFFLYEVKMSLFHPRYVLTPKDMFWDESAPLDEGIAPAGSFRSKMGSSQCKYNVDLITRMKNLGR